MSAEGANPPKRKENFSRRSKPLERDQRIAAKEANRPKETRGFQQEEQTARRRLDRDFENKKQTARKRTRSKSLEKN